MEKEKIKSIGLKFLVEISRVVLGATFMFSGFTKAVDPWGTAYKIEDYLSAFHLSGLSFLSFPISSFLCILEFLLGAFMLFGLYRMWTSRLVLLVMCFMTPLTLYLAIANPVDDCGCFGDALKISNWDTFYKNVVLIVLSFITFKYHRLISNVFTGKTYWLAFIIIIVFSLGFVLRNYIYEPIFDFRPYHIGANIAEKMTVEPGKERIEESILVYEKDGVEKEFTQDNFPWEDSTWVYVRTDSKVIQEGEDPQIKDFTLTKLNFNRMRTDIEGEEDITDEVLSDSNYTFLMISPSLEKLNLNYLSSLEDVEYYAKEYSYKFYCLTASVTDEIKEFIEQNSVGFNFCTVDERVLKTMARTNPALILLKGGIVINKWADLEVPSEKDLNAPMENLAISKPLSKSEQDTDNFYSIIVIFFLPLLLLKLFDFLVYRRRKQEEQEDKGNN